jgi:hypothetical protein
MVKRANVICKAVHVVVYSSNDWLQFVLTRVTRENRFPTAIFKTERNEGYWINKTVRSPETLLYGIDWLVS